MDRAEIKKTETEFLASEYKKNPNLFQRETLIDSPDFLEKIGIFLGKNNLPRGYLKLWPQDFIVEEISILDDVQTINDGDFFNKNKTFSEKDPTIYATLVKCKLPTFEATKEIASHLGIETQKIKSAGIKDTDAITSQLISIRGSSAEKLKKVTSKHYFLKNVYSGKGSIEVGSLEGNKFTILIRTDPDFNRQEFEKNLENIKKHGFYNFFYTQRFSNPRFINWFWGLLVLKGDYRNAILSFLCSDGIREISYFKNIRTKIKENFSKWDKVLNTIEPFPSILQNEIKVVKYLQKNPQDFVGALKQIEGQVQLWVFAYGSLLFNRKISEYISSGNPVPKKLPLILNNDKRDWLPYADFLKEDGIGYIPIKNLTPFYRVIQWKKREVETLKKVQIHKIEFLPEGVVMNFSLDKGCYATTFLAHLFQLVTSVPPKNISTKQIDPKEILGEKSIKDIIERFREVTFSKSDDIFEKQEQL